MATVTQPTGQASGEARNLVEMSWDPITRIVDINLGIRILLGHSFYDDWADSGEMFVAFDPLGNPADRDPIDPRMPHLPPP